MNVGELIAKLQEIGEYRLDAPVVFCDAGGDWIEIETAGPWSMYDDDNVFIVLNDPDDKASRRAKA